MNRTCKHSMLVAALASLMAINGQLALADSLVTTDGDVILGTVTKTSTGYTVQTSDGPVDVAAEKVKRILYDHPHAAPQPTGVPAATPGATGAKKTVDPREITALTQQGQAAMAAGEFTDARDAFADLLSVDNKNATAGRGLGYAYLKLSKPTKALKPLELAALTQPLDRSLTIALAASLVASHNPMRAAKFVKTYLEAHPTPLDEPMVNTLGIALSQADATATRSTLFNDGVKLYNKFNADLEATQPGKKRWGIEWQDADAVTQKFKVRQEAQKKADDAWSKLQAAKAQLSSAQNDLSSAAGSMGRNDIRAQQMQAAQNRINTASTAVDKAQSVYDDASKALADIPGPIFPDVVALEDVDLSMAPPGALVSAAPPPSLAGSQPKPDTTVPPVIASAPPEPVDTKPEPAPTPTQTPTPTDVKPDKPRPAPKVAAAPPVHLTRHAVGFAIAPDMLVTAASAVEGATDIQIGTCDGRSITAEVVRTLHGEGLALLKADGAHLQCLPLASTPSSAGLLACYGFPEVELFNPVSKQMTASSQDQADTWTVSFSMTPRLPGGPLLKAGTVVGVELGDRDSDLGQIPAATLKSLLTLVGQDANAQTTAQDPRQAVVMVTAER